MTEFLDYIGWIILIIGCCFIVVSAIGCIRMPDFYSRMHAAGIGDNAGCLLALLGLSILNGFNITSAKLIILGGIIILTSPTNTFALMQAAIATALKPIAKIKVNIFKDTNKL
jgi:multicomponent Na+:H+ antiporter subunit G